MRLVKYIQTRQNRHPAPAALACAAFFAAFTLLALLLPETALAWGPGAHMVTGNWVLQNLASLPPDIAEALMRYPGQYLYGSLSADIFIGKGSKAKEGHSHNWESGLSLLAKADNQRRKAYALGYLSHLAADTVAHNIYVPGTFNSAPGKGRLAHVYIEWHADASLMWDRSDARGVFHEAGSLASERILRNTVSQKAWKFWLKKHIYERSISLGGSRGMRRYLGMMDHFFPGQERLRLLDYMLTLSTRGIVSLLRNMENSPVLSLDPIGADALSLAGAGQNGAAKINIVVPDLMRDLPQVCTPESFFGTENEPESE